MKQLFLKGIAELSQFLFAFSSNTVCLGSLPTEAKEGLSIPKHFCHLSVFSPWFLHGFPASATCDIAHPLVP